MKKIINIILWLTMLQITRIGFKSLVFIFLDRSLMTEVIISSIYMIIMIILSIIIIKKKQLKLNIFPKSFNWKYIVTSIILFAIIFATPIIIKNYSVYDILSLLYGAVITVIFEEIIFRGYVYKEIGNIKNDFWAYIISTVLFGIWHLGYVDTVIWRASIISPNAKIINIMFWKVITGLLFGVVVGFFRYKNKNVYSSMIVHALLNTFGR